MSVNSKMTAIADAVRDLRGMSGAMGLDAMATNINGAKTAVDSALAVLSEKGVTVPAGTKVDGLAALIAAIEAGGGGGSLDFLNAIFNATEIQAGTCTTAENSTSATTFTFDKPFNAKPNYYLIFEISPPPDVTQSRVIMNMAYSGKNNTSKNAYNVILAGKNYNPMSGASLGAYGGYTNTTFSIVGNSSYPILAGTTYGWIVLKGEF